MSETHQVILHRYIYEKLQEIANEDYGIKPTCPYEIKNYSRYTISKDMKKFIKHIFLLLSKLNTFTSVILKQLILKELFIKFQKMGKHVFI